MEWSQTNAAAGDELRSGATVAEEADESGVDSTSAKDRVLADFFALSSSCSRYLDRLPATEFRLEQLTAVHFDSRLSPNARAVDNKPLRRQRAMWMPSGMGGPGQYIVGHA